MRVLVTGATGFLGTRLLPMLAGHEVLCLSRQPSRLPQQDGVIALAGDLTRDGEWMAQVAAFHPDCCFHLAWEGLPDYSLDRCRINVDAGLRLFEVVAQAGVKTIVVAGSCWEYGSISGAVPEPTAPGRLGTFAAAKHALLTMLESVADTRTITYRWARLFFVYGPGQRATSLIPHLCRAFTHGRAPEIRQPGTLQDFVHVDDVASALLALAACDAGSGVFNVGTGQATSVALVANHTASCFGAPLPYPTIPAGDGFWADMTKTVAATGWCPRIAIDEGIRRTVAAIGEAA
jgi:UDP-glucose 4-epimerase